MSATMRINVDKLLERFQKLADDVDTGTGTAARSAANVVEGSTKRYADRGRPGPIWRTGGLVHSIGMTSLSHTGYGQWESRVAPTAPQARRLELGFGPGGSLGVDRIGRRYHQKPYPYFAPGLAAAISSGHVYRSIMRGWTNAIDGIAPGKPT